VSLFDKENKNLMNLRVKRGTSPTRIPEREIKHFHSLPMYEQH